MAYQYDRSPCGDKLALLDAGGHDGHTGVVLVVTSARGASGVACIAPADIREIAAALLTFAPAAE